MITTMNKPRSTYGRRDFLRTVAGAAGAGLIWPLSSWGAPRAIMTRPVPSSGEALPVIGLGSWITFNVGDDPLARANCTRVMEAFFAAGGRIIDCSPMYGSSMDVIGHGLARLGRRAQVFAADKVWTPFLVDGAEQIAESRQRWGIRQFDLMQVHNLVDWEEHLPMLFAKKAAGEIRYVGLTTSESRRHAEFEAVMRRHPLDFIQISYNIRNRRVEERLLPLAQDRGMAVIANRPFQQSRLIDWAEQHPLPEWAAEIDCANWAQFLLKFIVAHPAVTCAIPATSRVDHLRENMGAGLGRLPDAALRQRMIRYVEHL